MEQEKITQQEIASGQAPENLAMYSSREFYDAPPKKKPFFARFFGGLLNILTFGLLNRNKRKQSVNMDEAESNIDQIAEEMRAYPFANFEAEPESEEEKLQPAEAEPSESEHSAEEEAAEEQKEM